MAGVKTDEPIMKKVDYYINLIIDYRWLILIPFLICMLIGIYHSLTTPKLYQAVTSILVEPQRIPSKYVRSIVEQSIESRLNTIKQQILSRTNLEVVIQKFGLFNEPGNEKMFLEDKLKSMRKRISINVIKARGGADAFSLSFIGKNPEKVKNVTNTLAQSFITINLKVRENKAVGTSAFLDSQLNERRRKLEEMEAKLITYRQAHMGELPEQLQTNLKILERIEQNINDKRQSLRDLKFKLAQFDRDAKEKLLIFESQLAMQENLQNLDYIDDVDSEPAGQGQLQRLKAEYSKMQLKYKKNHPDLRKLKSIIDKLETDLREKEQQTAEKDVHDKKHPTKIPESEIASSIRVQKKIFLDEMDRSRAEIVAEIDIAQAELIDLERQAKEYQRRVEATPKREQELISLKRDYDNIKKSYNSLLDRKLEAEMALNMEKRSKGEQFRVLDPARRPEKPVSPDIRKVFAIFFGLGISFGTGIVILLDFLDSSFRRIEDIENQLEIKVIGNIPKVYSYVEKKKIKIKNFLFILFFGLTICSFLIFSLITLKGTDIILKHL